MKPSERIIQICDEMCERNNAQGLMDINIGEKAIIQYLDELHEQQKPKHECKLNHCVPKCNKGNIVDEIVEKWKF